MRHPYRIREIAEQAKLSTATVDRVLHARPGVRASTVVKVQQAIAALDREASKVRSGGRPFPIDLVMLAPSRFTTAVRAELEAELPTLRPAVTQARFHLWEAGSAEDVVRALDAIAGHGSYGIILTAPNDPAVVAAVARLKASRIPVVTIVTDLPTSRRVAYVGIDDRAAGATAAYLLAQSASDPDGILFTRSVSSFRPREQREAGFRATVAQLAPGRRVYEVAHAGGPDASMLAAASVALEQHADIDTVYSGSGGNRAILEAFERAGRDLRAFVADDLDEENLTLLRHRQLTAVLHHDLRADLRQACRAIMQAHRAVPGRPVTTLSQIQVITPYNEPGDLDEGL